MVENEPPMNRPTVKNEVNLSTMALVMGMFVTVAGFVYSVGQFTAQVDDLKGLVLADATRIATVEGSNRDMAAKYDNLAYRTTVVEQHLAAHDKVLSELKDVLASQSADIRVIREIVSRLDKDPKR